MKKSSCLQHPKYVARRVRRRVLLPQRWTVDASTLPAITERTSRRIEGISGPLVVMILIGGTQVADVRRPTQADAEEVLRFLHTTGVTPADWISLPNQVQSAVSALACTQVLPKTMRWWLRVLLYRPKKLTLAGDLDTISITQSEWDELRPLWEEFIDVIANLFCGLDDFDAWHRLPSVAMKMVLNKIRSRDPTLAELFSWQECWHSNSSDSERLVLAQDAWHHRNDSTWRQVAIGLITSRDVPINEPLAQILSPISGSYGLTRQSFSKIAGQFTPQDQLLIEQWSVGNSDVWKKAMQRARAAEIAVKCWLEKEGWEVKDTSIQQVSGIGRDWYSYDLVATRGTEERRIDVKHMTLVNDLVAKRQLTNEKIKRSKTSNVEFVGVVSHPDNDNLEILGSIQAHQVFAVQKMLFEFDVCGVQISPWLFSIQNTIIPIKKQDWVLVAEAFQTSPTQLDDLVIVALLEGIDCPEFIFEYAPSAMLLRQMLGNLKVSGVTGAFIALFRACFSINVPTADVVNLSSALSRVKNSITSGSALDALLIAASALAPYIRKTFPNGIDKLSMSAKSVLKAQGIAENKAWTLLSPCGNMINKKQKCAFWPLIAGEHLHCNYCYGLVCPSCGSCTPTCAKNSIWERNPSYGTRFS